MKIEELYRSWAGREAASCVRLPGAGSNRVYYRIDGCVGVEGTSAEENRAFIGLARHFASKGLNVPQVLAVSEDGLCYLQTDLGSTSLFDALREGRKNGHYTEEHRQLLRRTIAHLPRLQHKGAEGLDWSLCYPMPEMNRRSVMFDLNYFKYCFLKTSGTDFNEVHLEDDFEALASDLLEQDCNTFQYRDFQARNIMIDDKGEPWFIDFQGGRRGPALYDLASFLWQASARYPDELKAELIEVYKQNCPSVPADFDERLRRIVLFRTMQVLGAYGFRGRFEKKAHFIASIPPALDNLQALLDNGAASQYPYLAEVLGKLCRTQKENQTPAQPAVPAEAPALTVTIKSFSYKRGIPADESGNGGGYVFDCRSTHNPGRYEPYKQLTGLDAPVIKFLEDDGEILAFLDHVYALADVHVARYIERGFTHLMFCFGCTGGQHRSVYCAQHLAEHLNNKFGVKVELEHREQNIRLCLGAKTV